jgi:hypothetical protein
MSSCRIKGICLRTLSQQWYELRYDFLFVRHNGSGRILISIRKIEASLFVHESELLCLMSGKMSKLNHPGPTLFPNNENVHKQRP